MNLPFFVASREQLKPIRKALIGASALLSVGGLLAFAAFPANLTMSDEGSARGSVSAQSLVSADVEPGARALDALGEVGAEQVPIQILGANGLFDPRLLSNTALRYPFDQQTRLTDGFGYRSEPVAGFHNAQDFDPGAGAQIKIIGDGIVTKAVFGDWCGFGLQVQHKVGGQDVTSLYCHMQEGSHGYQVGDRVKSGDIAGRVGNTGQSFGAHLHLVLRVNGQPVDPIPFITSHASA